MTESERLCRAYLEGSLQRDETLRLRDILLLREREGKLSPCEEAALMLMAVGTHRRARVRRKLLYRRLGYAAAVAACAVVLAGLWRFVPTDVPRVYSHAVVEGRVVTDRSEVMAMMDLQLGEAATALAAFEEGLEIQMTEGGKAVYAQPDIEMLLGSLPQL